MSRTYLDHAAATPTRPEVLEAMLSYFRENFGNPSAVYDLGSEKVPPFFYPLRCK
jgi:cysteine desulfurase